MEFWTSQPFLFLIVAAVLIIFFTLWKIIRDFVKKRRDDKELQSEIEKLKKDG